MSNWRDRIAWIRVCKHLSSLGAYVIIGDIDYNKCEELSKTNQRGRE